MAVKGAYLYHRVSKVNDGVSGFGPHIAPAICVIEHLQSADNVEKHGHAAIVRVAHQARLGY